jgi:hypothetical protein
MAAKTTTIAENIRTIDRLTRLNNSVNGNPRYRVHFTDGSSALTTSDAMFCYSINNREMRDVPLVVTWTRAGRIAHLEPVT